ncbi:TPA: AAA family ATPase [Candidatus Woesearchaeota archaeon]|nr:AAA family ATPase [Candidatus Woesearchaeota archaeon]
MTGKRTGHSWRTYRGRSISRQKEELSSKPGSIRREVLDRVLQWFADDRIIILTGIRRCGKSTLLSQIMENKAGWCYVNFEDERLLDFEAQDFEMLNDVLVEAYGPSRTYFFDEIQNVQRFETFVRRLQDEKKKVVITGSNAA